MGLKQTKKSSFPLKIQWNSFCFRNLASSPADSFSSPSSCKKWPRLTRPLPSPIGYLKNVFFPDSSNEGFFNNLIVGRAIFQRLQISRPFNLNIVRGQSMADKKASQLLWGINLMLLQVIPTFLNSLSKLWEKSDEFWEHCGGGLKKSPLAAASNF